MCDVDEKIREHTETVRLYVRAMRIETRRAAETDDTSIPEPNKLQLGDEVSRKRKKKEKNVFGDERLRASLAVGGERFTASELGQLRANAMAAMQAASEHLGESVKYCCGMVRPVRDKCPGECAENKIYQEVNNWEI